MTSESLDPSLSRVSEPAWMVLILNVERLVPRLFFPSTNTEFRERQEYF